MKVKPIPAAIAALLLTGAALAAEPVADSREENEKALVAAQQRLDAAVQDVERLSSRLGAHFGQRFGPGSPDAPPRSMLGVQVSAEGAAGGAQVLAVSPGGPAEAAGIEAGDLITAIDGKDLTRAEDAGRALRDALGAQEPGRKVNVRLMRDGKAREFQVTTRAAPRVVVMRRGMPGMPPGPPPPRDVLHDAGPPRWEQGPPLAGMELATLSERLGSYFGAKQGVLVVRAGRNDTYKLQDGDVIVAIDGRAPTSASHATRILRSYQRGEKLQIKVLRERKPQTLEVTLPGA